MKKILKNDKVKIIGLVIILIIVISIRFIFFNNTKKQENINNEIVLLNDANRFFTVSSVVNKFIKYLGVADNKNIYKMTSNDYKKKNNLTEENILDDFPKITGTNNFKALKIYKQQITKTKYKYYVYGKYSEIKMDTDTEEKDLYLIVYLYTDNTTFSVEPYNGKLFKEKR